MAIATIDKLKGFRHFMTPNTKGKNRMSTENTVIAPKTEKIPVQISSLDGNLNDVVAKKFVEFTPSTNFDGAISSLSADEKLAVVNSGLRTLAMKKATESNEGFFIVDENGEVTETPFSGGALSDEKVKQVQANILSFAKMAAEMSGETWDKALSIEKKRAFKESAKEAMKNSPAIMKMISGS